jgi:hypothetical protein
VHASAAQIDTSRPVDLARLVAVIGKEACNAAIAAAAVSTGLFAIPLQQARPAAAADADAAAAGAPGGSLPAPHLYVPAQPLPLPGPQHAQFGGVAPASAAAGGAVHAAVGGPLLGHTQAAGAPGHPLPLASPPQLQMPVHVAIPGAGTPPEHGGGEGVEGEEGAVFYVDPLAPHVHRAGDSPMRASAAAAAAAADPSALHDGSRPQPQQQVSRLMAALSLQDRSGAPQGAAAGGGSSAAAPGTHVLSFGHPASPPVAAPAHQLQYPQQQQQQYSHAPGAGPALAGGAGW